MPTWRDLPLIHVQLGGDPGEDQGHAEGTGAREGLLSLLKQPIKDFKLITPRPPKKK